MDIVTHGLASLALARGFFPRGGRVATVAAIVAGCLAELDWLANYFGPPTALAWRWTALHSIVAAILFSVLVIVLTITGFARGPFFVPLGKARESELPANDPETIRAQATRMIVAYFLVLPLCAALLHIAMDACQSNGVMLLWPFSTKRFATDWLPPIDPWILTILVLAIGIPELLGLVSSEIGAKSKQPRGRTGALIGLALVALYVGGRAILHSNAVALMESRTFHGEPARRALAFPEALSLLTWHGIAETETALNLIDVNLAASGAFDPDTSVRLFKPEQSAILDAAEKTRVAKQFLAAARMPRASVEKTDVGYVVILRDMRYAATGETQHSLAVLIEFDPEGQLSSQEVVWVRELRNSL